MVIIKEETPYVSIKFVSALNLGNISYLELEQKQNWKLKKKVCLYLKEPAMIGEVMR